MSTQVKVTLTDKLSRWIRSQAKLEDLSVSGWIHRTLAQHHEHKEVMRKNVQAALNSKDYAPAGKKRQRGQMFEKDRAKHAREDT